MRKADRKRHVDDPSTASKGRADGGRSVPTGNPDVDNGQLKTGTVPGQPLPAVPTPAPPVRRKVR
jgi:hypothetical protein